MDLRYIRRVNGINPSKTLKDMEIDEMVQEYNEAKENVITRFQLRIRSTDAVDVTIDNSNEIKKALIDNGANKPTKLDEYEKLIQMNPNELRTGAYINVKNEQQPYLVVSAIDKENSYEEAKIKQCNLNLKLKDIDGNIVSIPCYYINQTMYNIGIKMSETNPIRFGDTIVKLYMGAEIGRRYIYRGLRFLIMVNGRPIPYESTYLDTSQDGLLIFQASECKVAAEDDFENMVAYNYKENNNLPIEPKEDLHIEGIDLLNIKSQYIVTGDTLPYGNLDFNFEVDRPDFAKVEKIDDKTCLLYGLKAKEYVVLKATCGDINLEKDILIKDVK